ncbi:MAG TPA: tRNA 2-thiouridine(34) synthase MnmA [Tepidisphaeraceae bacterium]|nr:tRNA 2-thiouridine(34) synthase MnmA [Tepidisphaeraceae bacterium]
MESAREKVVVAMSGGVDSSVAAALLLRQGYDVIGVFMRLGSPKGVEMDPRADETCDLADGATGEAAATDTIGVSSGAGSIGAMGAGDAGPAKQKQGCCSVLDAADARRVAGLLGVPFYVLNFEDDFGRVIDYFVSEYNRGRTPNPCVRCNDWLKFGKLAKYAEAVGARFVSSGHYARVGVDPATGAKALLRGLDHRKDQSYVLFGMSRQTLEHTLLPIGGYEKHDVRAIAAELNLPVFNKPDSQEICFVPNQDYAGLVRRRSPETFRRGKLVTADGQLLGEHQGHQHFTIGQRKGVGVALGYPIYVVDIDPAENRVTLGEKSLLDRTGLVARQVNFLSSRPRQAVTMKCLAKIRYNHQPVPATLRVTGADEFEVTFDAPQPAVTPGQAVVLYDDDIVLGGGWIERAL